VRATNAAGDSSPTGTATARPMPPVPQAPSGLTGSPDDTRVTLRWTASPTPNVYYVLEYRNNPSAQWTRMPYPITSCCGFVAGYLMNGFTYQFRLRATNMSGDSAPTAVVSARPMPPVPDAPNSLSTYSYLSDNKMTAFTAVGWRPSINTSSVTYQLHYRNITRQTGWVKGYWGTNLSDTSPYYTGGETYEVKVSAENMSGIRYSGTIRFTAMRNKPSMYGFLTANHNRSEWRTGKNNNSLYSAYGFNWDDDGCSNPLDTKFTYEYGNAFFNSACERHDFGYRNHGSWGDRGAIDGMMYYDMKALCTQEISGGRSRCESSADNYYAGIRAFGWKYW